MKLIPVKNAPLQAVVATNIRAEAAKRGLSQTQLARMMGKHQVSISERWRGVTAWSLNDIEAVAELFEMEPAELLHHDKNAPAFVHAEAKKLPRLDSNQQPSGYRFTVVAVA